MSKKLTKGRPRPHLQNQSANPEDWLIRNEEGSFMDNDTEDIEEGWTICENYSSVFNIIMQFLSVIFVKWFLSLYYFHT